MFKTYQADILPIDLVVGNSASEFKEHFTDPNGEPLELNEGSGIQGTTFRALSHDGYRWVGILLNKNSKPSAWAHEALHATQFILEHLGIYWEIGSTNEIYSYVLEWMMRKISQFVSEL